MPLPPRPLNPARLPGRSDPRALDAAGAGRPALRIIIVIALALVAIPGLFIIAVARLQGERR